MLLLLKGRHFLLRVHFCYNSEFLLAQLRCFVTVALHLAVISEVFRLPEVDIEGFHIYLAHITVAELWTSCMYLDQMQAGRRDVLWNSTNLFTADVAEHSDHRRKTRLDEDFYVGDSVLP